MDKHKNGFIDQHEFIVAFMDRGILCNENNLKATYRGINYNRNSGITLDDMKMTLPALALEND